MMLSTMRWAPIHLLQRALCASGWHYLEPVLASHRGPYVLLRCTRCGSDHPLVGKAAEEWITRYLRG